MRGFSLSSATPSSTERRRSEVAPSGDSVFVSSIRSPVEALAVPDRGLQADRILDQIEQLNHALDREAALFRQLLDGRING